MAGLLINGAGGKIGSDVTGQAIRRGIAEQHSLYLNEPRVAESLANGGGLQALASSLVIRGHINAAVFGDSMLVLNGFPVHVYAEKDVSKIPIAAEGIKMVLECSGFYGDPKDKTRKAKSDNGAREFLKYGVERVIQTYPAVTADDMLIMGVNNSLYDPSKHTVISNASCTTKSLAMPLQVLIDNGIGVDALSMVTIHAETGKELSRLEKALEGPTTTDELRQIFRIESHSTGATKALGSVIPSLAGRMNGTSFRVPAQDGSFSYMTFVALSDNELTVESLNDMMRTAVSNPKYCGRMGVYEDKVMATKDIVGRTENAVIATAETKVIPLSFDMMVPNGLGAHLVGKKLSLVTMVSAYDNELGSSVDPVLLANYVAMNSK